MRITVSGGLGIKVMLQGPEQFFENRVSEMNVRGSVAFGPPDVHICQGARAASIRCMQPCDWQAAVLPWQ